RSRAGWSLRLIRIALHPSIVDVDRWVVRFSLPEQDVARRRDFKTQREDQVVCRVPPEFPVGQGNTGSNVKGEGATAGEGPPLREVHVRVVSLGGLCHDANPNLTGIPRRVPMDPALPKGTAQQREKFLDDAGEPVLPLYVELVTQQGEHPEHLV